jgi:hypothetical protein
MKKINELGWIKKGKIPAPDEDAGAFTIGN